MIVETPAWFARIWIGVLVNLLLVFNLPAPTMRSFTSVGFPLFQCLTRPALEDYRCCRRASSYWRADPMGSTQGNGSAITGTDQALVIDLQSSTSPHSRIRSNVHGVAQHRFSSLQKRLSENKHQ